MGRIVVSEFVTIDGVFEDPGGAEGFRHGGWAFQFDRGPAGDAYKLEELLAADALLLGRTTYLGFARAWPSITDEQGFADKMNAMRKYVVSSTLPGAEATWNNSTILRDDAFAQLASLRGEPGRELLVAGSGTLAGGLIARGLVDELRLMVYPVVLGGGRRLFPTDGALARFTLAEAKPARSGIVMLTYRTETPAA